MANIKAKIIAAALLAGVAAVYASQLGTAVASFPSRVPIGGDFAPKNHLCSGEYLMEGCAKLVSEEIGPGTYVDFVYLIAACREGRDSISGDPVNEYDVTFKPYFSGSWFATSVEVIEPDGTPTQLPVVNGTFTDTFEGEDVRIYKFQKPPRFGESQ
jgi:hypothetical protein